MTGCECKTPGMCKRHNVNKSEAWWNLCRTNEKYFKAWEEGRGPGQNIPALHEEHSVYRGFRGGPGTELKKILAKFGITESAGCKCKERSAIMDRWGCDNCEYRIEEIVDWMAEEAKRRHLPFVRIVGKHMVRTAIRRARKAEHQFNLEFAAASKGFEIDGERVPRWEFNERQRVCMDCQKRANGACLLIAEGDNNAYMQVANKPFGACPLGKWRSPHVQWITTAEMVKHAVAMADDIPSDVGYVVGIPRSGLIPAAAIASHLHLPLYTVTEDGIVSVGLGTRSAELTERKGRGLIVDDTLASGMSLQRRAKQVPELADMLMAAVYVLPGSEHLVNYYYSSLGIPYLLEWNFFNCPYFQHIATDLDGIIAHGIDLKKPYFVPRNVPVAAIITARPEAERPQTEAFLRSIGCKWKWLSMWPGTIEEHSLEAIVKWKTEQFWKSFAEFYVESDAPIADGMRRNGVRVLCPEQGYLR